ncbi:hypothetical protein KDK_39410 [Dictyobacter kobayashii]|uniref:Uncharacterized protein n=2 Tax=Dictyobacter kobayashii TaxID=2014872 RepID=A0A402ALW2_9CHLR|nr:hypothetical protein KDK_39410 [Dictyobacter kobayashii]
MLMIIAIIFICLLFGLIFGLWLFRRMLLPPIIIKPPASGISSWTRSLVPDYTNSPQAAVDMDQTQAASHAFPTNGTGENGAGTFASGFISAPQIILSNTATMNPPDTETALDLPTSDTDKYWYRASE